MLTFPENKEHIALIAQYYAKKDRALSIIAVTPEADYHAEIRGLDHYTVEDLVVNEEMNTIGDTILQTAGDVAKTLDVIMKDYFHGIDGRFVSSLGLYHYIVQFMQTLFSRALPVIRAFDRFACEECFYFPPQSYEISGLNVFSKPSCCLTALIISEMARKYGISLDVPAGIDVPEPYVSANIQGEANRSLPNNGWTKYWLHIKDYFGTSERNRKIGQIAHTDAPVLILNTSLDFGREIEEKWRDNGGTVLYYGDILAGQGKDYKKYRMEGQRFWSNIKEHTDLINYFTIDGIDLFPVARPFFEILAQQVIPDMAGQAYAASRSLKNLKKTVIVTGGMIEDNSVVGSIAAHYGIPVISTHFGGLIGYCTLPIHERYDLAYSDYYVAGGNGAVNTLLKRYKNAYWVRGERRAQPVPIGLSWVDRLIEEQREKKTGPELNISAGNKSGKKRIMYVLSALVGDNKYLGYVFAPEIWYCRFVRKVITALNMHDDVKILIKPPLKGRYPQIEDPIFEWVERSGVKDIEIIEDASLDTVVDLADFFILDSPSTPLINLLVTEKPFILYVDRIFYHFVTEAREKIRKRAAFVDNEKDFFLELENQINTDFNSINVTNKEFLKHYCTYLNDGKSTERFFGFLKNLCNQS